MKTRFAILLLTLLVVPAVVYTQEKVVPIVAQASQAPAEARFEVVQVVYLMEPLLLKLDKYTGEVFELARNRDIVRDKGQASAWQLTRWSARPAPEEIDAQRVNFQIFSTANKEGLAFLINLNTGDTWSIYREQTAEREFNWIPVKTQKR